MEILKIFLAKRRIGQKAEKSQKKGPEGGKKSEERARRQKKVSEWASRQEKSQKKGPESGKKSEERARRQKKSQKKGPEG